MPRKSNHEGSTRQRSDGSWECVVQSKYVNPKTGNPKRIKRVGATEDEARRKALMDRDAFEKAIDDGVNLKINKRKTFGEYMEEYLRSQVKGTVTESTYLSYVRNARRLIYKFPIANYQLQMLTIKVFEDYYDTITAKYARKTCSTPIQFCKRCCAWLVGKSLLRENYAAEARTKQEITDEYNYERAIARKMAKEVFSPEDINKFYDAYKNNISQYAVIALFLLETAMRPSEFASLRNSSIDLENRRIDIVETRAKRFTDETETEVEEYVKVPKNHESRFVMMSDLCVECVQYMQAQTKLKCKNNPDDLLYPSLFTGKRRSDESMRVCFNDMCDKLGIDRDVHNTAHGLEGLSIYSLRHTSDTISNLNGSNVVATALKMGHKAIRTENVYTHPTEEGLSQVVNPSEVVLEGYKKETRKEADPEYQLYLKLKEKYSQS